MVATAVLVVVGLVAGVCSWLGQASQHSGVPVVTLLGAGGNVVPPAICVLGIGVLGLGLWPRATSTISYGVLAWSFLVDLVGGLAGLNHWLLDTSLFHQMAAAPAQPPNWTSGGVMAAVGVAAPAGVLAFTRRDLPGDDHRSARTRRPAPPARPPGDKSAPSGNRSASSGNRSASSGDRSAPPGDRSAPPGDLTARARIRDAAIRHFADEGYERTTIRGIAVTAGVSPGLLRHHFGSKEELRRAVRRAHRRDPPPDQRAVPGRPGRRRRRSPPGAAVRAVHRARPGREFAVGGGDLRRDGDHDRAVARAGRRRPAPTRRPWTAGSGPL